MLLGKSLRGPSKIIFRDKREIVCARCYDGTIRGGYEV